jgi:hypothetical protein
MSCGTGECGCGCGEFLHIHVKPKSEMKVTVPPQEPFATAAVLADSQETSEESGS